MIQMHNVLRAAFLVAFSTTLGLAPLTGDVNTLAQSLPTGESQLVAVNISNFQPELELKDRWLTLRVPVSYFEGPVNQILAGYAGRQKDTEFNRVDISGLRVSFQNGGLTVNGNWQMQHRERIVCIAGKCKHTPWTSVSGTFSQPFSVALVGDRFKIRANTISIRSADKWYQHIVDSLIPLFVDRGAISADINTQLATINNASLREWIIPKGAVFMSQNLGISYTQAKALIVSNIGSMEGVISNGYVAVAVRVK
jgi:hypothetical protein